MIAVEVNRIKYFLKKQLSVLEGCKFLGLVIPRFCYHEMLSVAGNCRMCLVEVILGPLAQKPMVSCAIPFLVNMKVLLDSPLLQKARSNVVEMLLLYHPLDCPVCDQAGECDLQDQTKIYGVKFSRHFFNKRGVENKFSGLLVKTIMSRCIHCTRCVRFNQEIVGKEVLGTINRGVNTEISFYEKNSFLSEISANVVDLCPVGALTLKPYAFKARPWELKITESIDLSDSLGSNVYIHHKNFEVFRILPKINKNLNESIISDKARFCYDSLFYNRLETAFVAGELKSFDVVFFRIIKSLQTKTFLVILCNALLSLEVLFLLKLLTYKYSHISLKSLEINLNKTNVYKNVTDTIAASLDNLSFCFIFSLNLEVEITLLNYKLRKKVLTSNLQCYSFLNFFGSNIFAKVVNLSTKNFILLWKGKNKFLSVLLLKTISLSLIFGEILCSRNFELFALIQLLKKINYSCKTLTIGIKANSAGSLICDIERISTKELTRAFTFLSINNDNVLRLAKILSVNTFSVIWLHTHISKLALKAAFVLPVTTEYETNGLFLNCESRPQISQPLFLGTTFSQSLIVFIAFLLGNIKASKLKFSFLEKLRKITIMPELFVCYSYFKNLQLEIFRSNEKISLYPIKSFSYDHYLINKNFINSKILVNCSLEMRNKSNQVF